MKAREPAPRHHARRYVAVAAAALAALAGWTLFRTAGPPDPHSTSGAPAPETPRVVTFPAAAVAPTVPAEHPLEIAPDGIPIMPADPSQPIPAGPVHPHPTDAAHLRIYREDALLGSLNGALDVKDASGMRQLLAKYREEYPEDAHELQAGYAIIADCLDHPGDASTAAASRYYDTELASTLRRYVRRHCLE